MPQHKGPDVPHRTPRTRALEIGTAPEGFHEDLPYCTTCGHPLEAGKSHTHYVESGPHVVGEGARSIQNNPIVVKE